MSTEKEMYKENIHSNQEVSNEGIDVFKVYEGCFCAISEDKRLINRETEERLEDFDSFQAYYTLYKEAVENWARSGRYEEIVQDYGRCVGYLNLIELGRFSMDLFDIDDEERSRYFDLEKYKKDNAAEIRESGFEGDLKDFTFEDIREYGPCYDPDEYYDYVRFAEDCIAQGDYVSCDGYYFLT